MDKELLKEYLCKQYQGWQSFLDNVVFPIFGEDDFEDGYAAELLESQPERRHLAETTGIRSIKQVGKIYVGVEPLQIFDVTVSDRVMMERNRVNIQRLIRAVMDQFSCAFMLFHYDDDTRWDWRFTFCRKSGNKEESTDSKRYTFLLGPGQSCRTARDNFFALYERRDSLEIKDIEDAFNVEKLSKEFFGKYKAQYELFVNYMVAPQHGMRDDYIDTDFDHTGLTKSQIKEREEKPIRDYVKKLLGRIVFLHFLQKKGWLGVPAGEEWGQGDRDFMFHLFENASKVQKTDFLDKVLEPLFADALDKNRASQGDVFDSGVEGFRNIRIPYLNGGLFERDELDMKPSHFPADYFNKLLTMLSQYNFTIDENDPDDAEVGVDPEMLGRIFENLLEDNKDKGAYYTPKEIVQYMCRESLIAYLQTGYNEENKERIRKFVTTHDGDLLGALKADIDKKLRDVKICDPAIGSGAFPMGLLRELFFCRSAIEPNTVERASEIKRHIIQNNIYGVDIERGAVEIARLRFWLSLIVDEKSPCILPNLDFKIIQGNSLISTFNGRYINLSDGQKHVNSIQIGLKKQHLRQLQSKYYAAEGEDKENLLVEIKAIVLDIIELQLCYERQSWFINQYKTGNLFDDTGESNVISEVKTLQKLSPEKAHIIELCSELKKRISDKKLSLKERADTNILFFDWDIMFSEVFTQTSDKGFDITIGNPPYISAPAQIASPELNEQRQGIVKCKRYQSLNEKWDLYVPFMELGLQLLRPNGVFAMIVPYPLTNQKYGKKLRKMITEEYQLLEIADLNGTKIFENATVSNCIPFVQKKKPSDELRISQIFEDRTIREVLRKMPNQIKQDEKNYVWNLTNEERTGSRFSGMNVLRDFCYISKGMVLNADEESAKGEFKKEDLISETQDEIHNRKYIEAKDIDKYQVKRVRYLEWNTERCPGRLSRPTFRELYDCPKLIMNCLGTINVTIDQNKHYLHNHSIYCAVLWKDLKEVSNKSISSSVKKFCTYSRKEMEILSGKVNLFYLLGILNSSMADQLLADQRGSDYHIYPEHIRNIPIPIASKEIQEKIAELAKSILSTKATAPSADVSVLEVEIDRLVYQLYGLTEEEIKIVEQSSN